MPAVTECPSCDARLDLKTQDRIGKRVRCPRCKEVFTAELVGERSRGKSRPSQNPRRAKPAAAPPAVPRSRKSSGRSKKKRGKKSDPKPLLIAGGVVLAVVVLGGIAASKFWGGGSADSADGGSSSPGTSIGGSSPPAEMTPLVSEPVSEEEAVSFAKRLANSVKGGDASRVKMFLNVRGIVERAIDDVDAPANFKQQYLNGIESGGQLGSQIIAAVKSGGSYEFVNHRNENGRRQILFRLNADSGLNYHLLDLKKEKNGRIAAGDFFISVTGEHISTTMRRLFVAAASGVNKSLIDRLMGKEQLLVKHWKTVQAAQTAFNRGSYDAGMRDYQQLPEQLQKEKFLLIVRIRAAGTKGLDSLEYEQSLKAFRDAYPNSLAASQMGIDFFLLKKDYQKSLAAIDVLDEFAQGDPYLNVMRGGVTLASGNAQAARDLLVPTLNDPVFGKDALTLYLDVALALNEHRETLNTLLALESKHGMQFPRDLTSVEGFEAFARSPEHAEFRTR